MAEVGGDLPHAGARLEHVGGVAVAQGVDADLVMVLHEAALVFGALDGDPDAGLGHGLFAVAEGLLEGDAGAFPAAPGGGEEPVAVAVPFPEDAEAPDERGAEGHLAGLAALGVEHAQDLALAVDVLGADVQGLAHAQPALIDEGEVGAVAPVAEGAQQPGDLAAVSTWGSGSSRLILICAQIFQVLRRWSR